MTETILEKIVRKKRVRIDSLKAATGLEKIKEAAEYARRDAVAHRFSSAISASDSVNIIAEFKRASPSKGVINDGADVTEKVRQYEQGGAAALSVLTEEDFFLGSLDDLHSARSAVRIPILRKDFVIDAFQIYESAANGTDAILLIVAALTPDELRSFQALAHSLGMDAVVEVHDADEMKVAAEIGAKIIGVNNRNLKTFEVSLDISRKLAALAPQNVVMIAESGITNAAEINELRELGYSAFLVGETLMRGNALKYLMESSNNGDQ
ncbi:MAG: indole-3-glycerol phosphate synthase TrpC [Acidobacteria bacterium]|nr:indole-3-glycerol phosphate synthase TrpC [Acidobacteriota bacterium]